MQILVQLKDHEDQLHKQFQWIVTGQGEISQLRDQIKLVFSIDHGFQELWFDGAIVRSNKSVNEAGMKDNDKCIVKHNCLPQWTALLGTVKQFGQTQDSEEKKVYFQLAKEYIKFLMDSNFLIVYADFHQRFTNIQKAIYKRYDRRMQNTVKAFFEKRLIGRNPIFSFADKTEGIRAGTICTIKYQDTVERFYLKTNHDAGRSGSPSRTELDMKELFIYRLLERLGVGATIHFVSQPTSVIDRTSKSFLYIASREVPEFRTFDEVEQTETDFINYVQPAIQILTIVTVLSIRDCHSKNVGVDNNRSPFIIDFSLDRLGIRNLERDFRNHVRASNQINEQIDEYSFKDRVKVGVDFLKKIEFEKKIDEAIQSFIENDKRSLDDLYPPNKTDDLEQYIEIVKENMNKFFTYSN